METAFSELPLALFTTLGPIGAGAFVVIAIVHSSRDVKAEQTHRIDRLSFIPFGVVVVGLLCSFGHLANPLHAPYVLTGVASSPLSIEIVGASIFIVVALLYCILVTMGKLHAKASMWFAWIVAALGLIFSTLTGLAYMMDTIISWSSPWTVVEPLAAYLLGGTLLGFVLAASAGCQGVLKLPATALITAGALVLIIALIGHGVYVVGLESYLFSGMELINGIRGIQVAAIVLSLAAGVLGVLAAQGKSSFVLSAVGLTCAFLAVFFGRLMFYGMQMSVGL